MAVTHTNKKARSTCRPNPIFNPRRLSRVTRPTSPNTICGKTRPPDRAVEPGPRAPDHPPVAAKALPREAALLGDPHRGGVPGLDLEPQAAGRKGERSRSASVAIPRPRSERRTQYDASASLGAARLERDDADEATVLLDREGVAQRIRLPHGDLGRRVEGPLRRTQRRGPAGSSDAASRTSPHRRRRAAAASVPVALPHQPQPFQREVGSTRSIVRACGAISSARPPVPIPRASAPTSPRIARRSRRPGRRSRRRAPTAAPPPSSCRSPSAAPRSRPYEPCGARNSASIEISIPGASTPPTYSPAAETTSKFVEVPKSTTMHGAP